jgi:hypothetical protein
MKTDFPCSRPDAGTVSTGQHRVDEHHLLRLRGARGRSIESVRGTVWISIPGQAQDIYLLPGERLVVPADGLVLVGSLDAAPATVAFEGGLSLRAWIGALLHRHVHPPRCGGQPEAA